MKKVAIIGLCLGLVSPAFAFNTTRVYKEGVNQVASLTVQDSETLYSGLDLDVSNSRSGKVKFFTTKDQVVSLECTESTVPFGDKYACHLSINVISKSPMTPVYSDNVFDTNAALNNQDDAQKLFTALTLGAQQGRSDVERSFQTSDSRAAIICTKSEINVQEPYACTVSIQSQNR